MPYWHRLRFLKKHSLRLLSSLSSLRVHASSFAVFSSAGCISAWSKSFQKDASFRCFWDRLNVGFAPHRPPIPGTLFQGVSIISFKRLSCFFNLSVFIRHACIFHAFALIFGSFRKQRSLHVTVAGSGAFSLLNTHSFVIIIANRYSSPESVTSSLYVVRVIDGALDRLCLCTLGSKQCCQFTSHATSLVFTTVHGTSEAKRSFCVSS